MRLIFTSLFVLSFALVVSHVEPISQKSRIEDLEGLKSNTLEKYRRRDLSQKCVEAETAAIKYCRNYYLVAEAELKKEGAYNHPNGCCLAYFVYACYALMGSSMKKDLDCVYEMDKYYQEDPFRLECMHQHKVIDIDCVKVIERAKRKIIWDKS